MSEESKKRWYATMVAKHGSIEAVQEFMRQSGLKGRKTGRGGFYTLSHSDPKRHKEISALGGRRKYGKD